MQVMFVNGVAVDRIVGFEPLGATDDFPTSAVRAVQQQWAVCTCACCRRRSLSSWAAGLGCHQLEVTGRHSLLCLVFNEQVENKLPKAWWCSRRSGC